MVIGNGLLASGFTAFRDNDEVLVFASGVSNSKETNEIEYEKEFRLLRETIAKHSGKKLIYFSTCGIFDESIIGSPYINHKIAMEQYISNMCQRFLIFRLPNVIGPTTNPHTFFNFFKNRILSGEAIHIQENATRYLVDIRDLAELLPLYIEEDSHDNRSINICFNNQMQVSKIIELYEELLNIKANKIFVSGGASYVIENREFIDFINYKGITISSAYNQEVLRYYLALIEQH